MLSLSQALYFFFIYHHSHHHYALCLRPILVYIIQSGPAKEKPLLFFSGFVKLWLILIFFGMDIVKKFDVNSYSFVHLTLILSLHYLVKWTSRNLAIYDNEFILGSACIGSTMIN